MEERVQKIIAEYGGVSRRAAEKLIDKGLVLVNGDIAVLGDKADVLADNIIVDGKPLSASPKAFVYIMLNKPVGYVTTMKDEKGRKTVKELVADIDERVYPVGRLDINSEGLLIMTNDGNLTNRLTHPSFEIPKTYRVTVTGSINKSADILRNPMELDGITVHADRVRIIKSNGGSAVMDITIHEGRNRQIRRMCYNAGLTVNRLTRIAEGEISLGRLKKGSWRYLNSSELEYLKSYVN